MTSIRMLPRVTGGAAVVAVTALTAALSPAVASAGGPFIGGLPRISLVGSTVPGNGDINPYGVAVITQSTGLLRSGHVLVSNFNASSNLQGTGTTIVEVNPGSGGVQVFAHITNADVHGNCPGGVGLTTALAVLQHHWVIVGSLPTSDGTASTAGAGCLIILDDHGRVVKTLHGHGINGPWDLAAVDRGDDDSYVFVTNVLNGTVAANGSVVNRGTVERIVIDGAGRGAPTVDSYTTIGSGFSEQSSSTALVVGPTGLALSDSGTLYVADTLANRIAAIPDALHRGGSAFTGRDVTANGSLNAPLGLTLAPNGDILTVNGNDGFIVETSPAGTQVARRLLDRSGSPRGAGALFGLAVDSDGDSLYFVDDATNTLMRLH